ncbi:E3 ubiquitin-protein ligase RING1-like isoform X2 [Amaranthus tricolor]|uniref:E3 ubiquitin-protein ligase RING1-like isoform X2 n=1 Tax=Amaranthus tricolor TaxID=29722 RepID=UPI0025842ED4|nr:E3 ubiquitin-protein ligase RING1-like isoform X2 [Amaranthus tricolor]
MIYDINLITTIIGFGMSSIFIVFVCTRLICRRLHVSESRRTVDTEPEIDLEQPMQSTDGLEPFVVAAIPTMKFHRDAFSSTEDSQCSICLGEYQEKEILRIMPKCSHSFHLSCIDPWLMKQPTCPVCRLPLKHSFDPKQVSLNVIVGLSTDEHNSSFTPGSRHSLSNAGSQLHHQSMSSNLDPDLRSESEPRHG